MPRKLLRAACIAALWLLIWTIAALAVGQSILLPTPLETLRALGRLLGRDTFWASVGASMLRIVAGYLAGMAAGVLLAILTSRFPWWHAFFSPILSIIKATPVASFIMLALVWIRTNGVPVFATSLIVLPVAWANVREGIASTDPDLLEMAAAFRMRPSAKLRRLYWPTVLPYFRAAATTCMGMAWKAGVAAEVIAIPRLSLGSRLYDAKIYLDTPALFATTVVIIVLSILLEKCIKWLAGAGGPKHA